jgi:hypothetical protein
VANVLSRGKSKTGLGASEWNRYAGNNRIHEPANSRSAMQFVQDIELAIFGGHSCSADFSALQEKRLMQNTLPGVASRPLKITLEESLR